ncbi:MAG TPA: enoyl-ACP reductase [Gammaproteobacteria bacterium]|nr:enoyl-ACP reductase [Gammaproteobacteria bacterium]
MGFLSGKRALITGVASNRSIAWGIARAMHREGAELAFTYPNDKLRPRVEKFAAELGSERCFPCDVTLDEQIDGLFGSLGEHWDGLDILVHSIGFAPREALEGRYIDAVTRESYRVAHDVSAYSFAALARGARPMMQGRRAAMLTMTYMGSVRAVPSYNVMGPAKASLEANVRFLAYDLGPEGIRVNAISAGPIKTLAAAGIGGLRSMLAQAERAAPLRRNITIDEVGNAAAFLCSDLASAITGEITYVDAGYNILGLVGESE